MEDIYFNAIKITLEHPEYDITSDKANRHTSCEIAVAGIAIFEATSSAR